MAFRDDASTQSSSEVGIDLDDNKVWEADMREAAQDDGYDANSMLAGDDDSSSQFSIGSSARDRLEDLREERIISANARRQADLADVLDGAETHISETTSFTASHTNTRTNQTRSARREKDIVTEDDVSTESSSSESQDQVDLENIGAPSESIKRENVMREVKRQFRKFLRTYESEAGLVYAQRLNNIVQNLQSSLVVEFQDLAKFKLGLAVLAGETPSTTLRLFDDVATKEVFRLFPNYAKVTDKIIVRLVSLPISDAIRNLRCLHMNMLCMVHGVVTRRSLVYPQLQAVKFDCLSCGYTIGPVMQTGSQEAKIKQCPSCQKPGPFRLNNSETQYRNYQTAILQETPGTVPPGRLPRWIEMILTEDLVDIARPGDEIQVTGIFKNFFDPMMNHRQGFPVFNTMLEVNAVRKRVDDLREDMTESEKKELLDLSKHPNIIEKITASICPSIHGNETVKAGIACSLFGGVSKEVNGGKHRMRGDINVLLVGDPGCAKSQFLKYVEKTSPRAVFTTGKGSTAVGLTAAVHKDSMTGEWTLEGGAMVIADKGHCLIDEFDKMGDQDRTSIHEAMEQQTISIAKAGIVTSLQARCSIVAAANPIMGHYDSTQTFENQVNLTQPILSRFDLLYAIRDTVDPIQDALLAKFVVNSHIRNHPLAQAGEEDAPLLEGVPEVKEDTDPSTLNPLPQKLLQRYILYARSTSRPMLENISTDRLVKFYIELRDDSAMKYESGVKIVVRHLESICRLAEAFAKMRLSHYVREDDVSRAIALFLHAFLSTLQYKRRETLKKKYNGYLAVEKQYFQILDHLLTAGVKEQCQLMSLKYGTYENKTIVIQGSDFHAQAKEYNIVERDIQRFFATKQFTNSYTLDANKDIVWNGV